MARIVNIGGRDAGGASCSAPFPSSFSSCALSVRFGGASRGQPDDKLLPSPDSLTAAIVQVAATEDARTGRILLWPDTGASLRRLTIGLGIATLTGLIFGIGIGLHAAGAVAPSLRFSRRSRWCLASPSCRSCSSSSASARFPRSC